eukprot:CAMPEP_0168315446 /NCGR_PEP_ID=MMETSP0210-20121227/11303_1 /TAXON_ID=40633 /ORGANISM="Condylostoma magnum, Strain COL2" /LENGTH=113 /DNA_ID=CAMNT_0008288719 /DNA_START=353 /DNA_END=694 /DNA_ORIENTATION=+
MTFASFYVSQPISVFSSISIAPYQNNSVTILESVSLNFRFTISSDMWKNDVFVVYTDDDWTTPNEPTCESLDETTEITNNFTAADGTSRLDCVADAENKRVYVYGLGNDIDIS